MNLINLDPFDEWDCKIFDLYYDHNHSETTSYNPMYYILVSKIQNRWTAEAWEVGCLW